MQVLIETRMNSLRLNESKAPKKGCLGRLEGVCADFKNPTRNGRLYPLELWKKVFDDPLFKEALKNKTLFGELDHPEDRFEPLVKHACIVMTDYDIDEDAGLIYGGFDILDTPDGRVLKNILDYGSVLGVSSRGQGDIIECADGERVDEDSYDFACFDVVSTPAVEKARQKVVESMNKQKKESFIESIQRQIKEAESTADLNIIRSVVRTSGLNDSDMESIIESIEDKCKSFDVGETISTVSKNDKKIVKESTTKKDKSAKTIRDNKKLYKCINGLREQISAYKHRETRYVECITNKESELSKMDTKIKSLDSKVQSLSNKLKQTNLRNEQLEERLSDTKTTLLDKNKQVNSLKESIVNTRDKSSRTVAEKEKQLSNVERQLDEQIKSSKTIMAESKSKIKSLQSENNKLRDDLKSAISNSKMLQEKITSHKSTESSLHEQIENYETTIKDLENEISTIRHQHDSEIKGIDNEVAEYSNLLTEAQQKINEKNDAITELKTSLKESQDDLTKQRSTNSKLSENLKNYQQSYIKRVSDVYGIDPDSIYHQIDNTTNPKQIDKMVESYRKKLDRYNQLGITDSGIDVNKSYVVESLNTSYDKSEAEEQDRLMTFLQSTANGL